MAAASLDPFHYQVSDAQGIKVATRDDGGPTTTLALVVKAGSRYESEPGLAHALSNFSFKSTSDRSTLRLQRESELLGSFLSSSVSRENIVLKAKFLRADLPYFLEAFADLVQNSRYAAHEFNEEVVPVTKEQLKVYLSNPAEQALEAAHQAAFHRGLGNTKYAVLNKFLTHTRVADYAHKAFNKSNIALVASGAESREVTRWVSEFFEGAPTGTALSSPASQFFGGQVRHESDAGSALVLGFPGTAGGTQFKPEFKVLAHLLGGVSQVKWNTGASLLSKATADLIGTSAVANHLSYTDAGLLTITVSGAESNLIKAGQAAVKAIEAVANVKPEEIKGAIQQAKYDLYAKAEDKNVGLEDVGQSVLANGSAPQTEAAVKALDGVTAESIKKAAKAILAGRASVGAVGNLKALPFAEEIGLKA